MIFDREQTVITNGQNALRVAVIQEVMWVHNIEAERWAGAYQRNPYPFLTRTAGLFLLETLGVDGGWLPLPTRPQRYCDPTSLVNTPLGRLHCSFPPQHSALLRSLRSARSVHEQTGRQITDKQLASNSQLFVRNLKHFNFDM